MEYQLAELVGDTVAVPQVVFAHLAQADGDAVRVALYLLQGGSTDPHTVARALALPSAEAAKRALQYWAGAGLLVRVRAGSAHAAEPNETKTVELSALNDPYAAVLCEEAQTAFGKALSRSELQRLVGLYITDGWQPDVILLCCAEVARRGKRTAAAVVRELARWHEDGVETGEDAEHYLQRAKRREEQCAEAAEIFGIAADSLTKWERGAIVRWYEEWKLDRAIIEEALLRAGDKTTVRYVDGILRSWRAQGITTAAAAHGQGQLTGSNIIAAKRPAAQKGTAAQKDLFNRDWNALFDEET